MATTINSVIIDAEIVTLSRFHKPDLLRHFAFADGYARQTIPFFTTTGCC